jgi:hypothetical protein
LALAVLAAKRAGGWYSGPWSVPAPPARHERGLMQQLMEDRGDVFADAAFAPVDDLRHYFG